MAIGSTNASGSILFDDYSGQSQPAQGELAGGQYLLTIPNAGYYDTASKLYRAQGNLAADIGLTAAKIAQGTTILGVEGAYVYEPPVVKASATFSYK